MQFLKKSWPIVVYVILFLVLVAWFSPAPFLRCGERICMIGISWWH